ncbi:MAG: hypothetical protein ABIH18_05960 [Candidatus Omnitrophota bacterium]
MLIRKKQLFISLICLFFLKISSFAAIIPDDSNNPNDGWKDPRAYRPAPILFSHGFAAGDPTGTWIGRNGQKENQRPEIDTKLWSNFKNYYYDKNAQTQIPITALQPTRNPYLEIVSYIDASKDERSQLIDRNSSVDTYKEGDYYISTEERKIGDSGWADKLNEAVKKMRDIYKDKNGYPLKINIICHSMGGLAAREYLTNSKYGSSASNVNDLVLIGVPNLGSPLATFATGLAASQRIAWLFNPAPHLLSSEITKELDKNVLVFGKIDAQGDAARDMDPGLLGSGFLKQLNSRAQPQNVDYYAVCGLSMTLWEYLFNSESGDTVVPISSQLGIGVLQLKDYKIAKNASHGTEILAVSKNNGDILLEFLDSEKPVVEITDPDPQTITETYENSINIKGKVSKEYLPADSLLQIEAVNQDTGEKTFETNSRELYPSDLWVPNAPNSVVAEFDKEIPLTTPGKYRITCKVQNPAKVTSEVKEVWIKKLETEGSNIIVHCHNPEGKEINSITLNVNQVFNKDVKIYDGNNLIGYGAKDATTHGSPISLNTGNHTIKVKFNGMELVKNVTLSQNETKSLIFEFKRTEFDIKNWIDSELSGDVTSTVSGSWHFGRQYDPEHTRFKDEATNYFPNESLIAMTYITYNQHWYWPYDANWTNDCIYNLISKIKLNSSQFSMSYDVNIKISGKGGVSVLFQAIGGLNKKFSLGYFPKNITGFDNWYVQSDTSNYPNLYVIPEDGLKKALFDDSYNIGSAKNGYHIVSLPSNENYTYGYFYFYGIGYAQTSPLITDYTYCQSDSKSGTLNKIKMSNIPYDLEEKAI